MKIGDRAHVTAQGFTLEGDGLARLDAYTVHCPGVFPSEQAEVRIGARSRHHARLHASLLRVLTPHPARRKAPCPNHERRDGACSGCALMELDEAAQRALKRDMLRQQFGLHVACVEAAPGALGYRYSSKRVVLAGPHGLSLGSYARGSHAPAAMRGCMVDHPRLSAAFDRLEAIARSLGIEPYDETTTRGDLRYVWGKTNGHGVILTLVTAHARSRAAELLPATLGDVASVMWSVQPAASNAMRGSQAQLLRGVGELSTRLLEQDVELGALGFLQPNPAAAELAYSALTALDPHMPRDLAFDLYAGAGVTTRHLRAHFAEVIACEAYPESAAALGVAPQTAEAFLQRALRGELGKPDLVIANPPRKGMGPTVCSALAALRAPELRIMSCGPRGLARDLDDLSTGYTLVSLRAFDTLPQTPHVELVATLRARAEP